MSVKIVAKFGDAQFHFGTDTVLTVGSGPKDDIKVKHTGIGACHLLLRRRGDIVKVECNNVNRFWVQDKLEHLKVVGGYKKASEQFTLFLGRSVNAKFKCGDPVDTNFIDVPNTSIVVFFTPAPVAYAPVKVRAPVRALPPVPVFTAEVAEVPAAPAGGKTRAPSRARGGKKRKSDEGPATQLDDTAADDSD
jgi:hypothetical protein